MSHDEHIQAGEFHTSCEQCCVDLLRFMEYPVNTTFKLAVTVTYDFYSTVTVTATPVVSGKAVKR